MRLITQFYGSLVFAICWWSAKGISSDVQQESEGDAADEDKACEDIACEDLAPET